MGYFRRNKIGLYLPVKVSLTTTQDIPNQALRRRHEQNLDAAKESLRANDVTEREFTFITMSIDKSKINDAKKMIRDFRDKMCSYLEEGAKNEVYELSIQLFHRTKLLREKE